MSFAMNTRRPPKIGRNDACPCGSGRKYKKCCQGSASAPRTASVLDRWRGPATRVDRFGGAVSCEEQFESLQALLDAEDVSPDRIFDALADLRRPSCRNNERHRFMALLERLDSKFPEACAADSKWYDRWLLIELAVAGRFDAIRERRDQLAGLAVRQLDLFNEVRDVLAWHGCAAILADVCAAALDDVRASGQIMPWGKDEFDQRTLDCAIFKWLDEDVDHEANCDDLCDRLRALSCLGLERLERHIDLLRGKSAPMWPLEALDVSPDKHDAEALAQNLSDLSILFVGEIHRLEGVSWTRADLARQEICRYLIARATGQIKGARRETPRRHPLCPDPATLWPFVERIGDFFTYHLYKAAAFFELLPSWLRFLQRRGLVDDSDVLAALRTLHGIFPDVTHVLNDPAVDPTVHRMLEGWRAANPLPD